MPKKITKNASSDSGDTFVQGVSIPLSPLSPQANSGVGQTIQIHCGKLEPFSAIDFKGFCFLSIFTIYTVNF